MIIPIWQRLLGALVYILPWSDAIPFGRVLYQNFPILQLTMLPAMPMFLIERAIPFGSLLIFFILFIGIVRNQKIPYFIRFNTLQALLIDIGIILISYAFQILLQPLGNALIIRTLSSTILLAILTGMIFCLIECLQGKEPDLPGISQAVKMQIY